MPLGDLTILVPVDVSEPDLPALSVLEVLRPFEVVLLGYFPVPDQAEPALIRQEYEDEAGARLAALAEGRSDVTEVLVFTHDREATIDRVADEHDCAVVLTAGDTDHLDRILVPIKGDANVERIVDVLARLLGETDATATLFHAADAADVAAGEMLLRGAVDRLTDQGVDPGRVDRSVTEAGDAGAAIAAAGDGYDLVVLGETEPSLRERIIGDTLSRIIDGMDVPALVVRDVE